MKNTFKIMYSILFVILIFSQPSFSQDKFSLSIGGYGQFSLPTSESFRYFFNYGYGGGIILQGDISKQFSLFGFAELNNFNQKKIDDFFDNEGTYACTRYGIGSKIYYKIKNLNLFIEPTLSFRTINFYLYSQDGQNVYEVGNSDNKLGFSIGTGIDFDNITTGIRWINLGAKNITFLSLYFEYKFQLL